MSKSFIKLVDYAVLPALLMLLGKFAAVSIISNLLGHDLTFSAYSSSIFSITERIPESDLIIITSFSDLIAYVFVAILVLFVTIRAIYFHDTHIKPTLTTKLINKNMMGLIHSSYEIYHAATVYLIFLWIVTFITVGNGILGNSYWYVSVISLVISCLLTAILYLDIKREINNIKNNPGRYSWK